MPQQVEYEILVRLEGFWTRVLDPKLTGWINVQKFKTGAITTAKDLRKRNPEAYTAIKVVKVTREVVYEEGR